MRPFVMLVALLAWVHQEADARSGAREFICEGAGKSNGYPYGDEDTGRMKFRVLDDGETFSVSEIQSVETNLCVAESVCSVSRTGDKAQLVVRDIPNNDPLYSSRFDFNRRKLSFKASGGGLDGGWWVSGRCKAEAVAKP